MAGVLLALALCVGAAPARAADHGALERLLTDSHSFRVRARAALALGSTEDTRVAPALERGLRDGHPAVRAAAARALARVGTQQSVGSLRKLASDVDPEVATQAKLALQQITAREAIRMAVPAPPPAVMQAARPASLANVRYVLVVGDMRKPDAPGPSELTAAFGRRVADELRALPKVAVFTLDQMTATVADEIARRKLPALRFDGNLTHVQVTRTPDALTMRCEVSLLLMDEPERTLRSMLKGAATGSDQPRGPRDQQLQRLTEKTLRAAVRSALGNVSEAIAAAATHRESGIAALDTPARRGRSRRSSR